MNFTFKFWMSLVRLFQYHLSLVFANFPWSLWYVAKKMDNNAVNVFCLNKIVFEKFRSECEYQWKWLILASVAAMQYLKAYIRITHACIWSVYHKEISFQSLGQSNNDTYIKQWTTFESYSTGLWCFVQGLGSFSTDGAGFSTWSNTFLLFLFKVPSLMISLNYSAGIARSESIQRLFIGWKQT